jgi:hypothetical protein
MARFFLTRGSTTKVHVYPAAVFVAAFGYAGGSTDSQRVDRVRSMSASRTEKSQSPLTIPFCTASWSVRHLRSILPLAPARLPNRESYHTVVQHQHGASTHMPNNLWQPGESGNPAGRVRGSRNKLSEAVICALLRDFSKHGEKAIAKVRRDKPGVYLKVIALLIPREHKVEHSNPIKDMTDEQLEAAIEYIESMLAAQAGGASVNMINGEVVDQAALSPPVPVVDQPRKRPNRLLEHADTAVGPRERKPRKVPLPSIT